jgi:hypothetical protein
MGIMEKVGNSKMKDQIQKPTNKISKWLTTNQMDKDKLLKASKLHSCEFFNEQQSKINRSEGTEGLCIVLS